MARILCVDDEPTALRLKCAILNQAGHTATAANSLEEALACLQGIAFDAIVTDWQLGTEDGRPLVKAAKNLSGAPVIVVSGYVSQAFQSAEPAADLYLEKPVDPEELVKIIATLLGPANSAAAPIAS